MTSQPLADQETALAVIREALAACEGFRPRVALPDVGPEHRLVEDLGVDSVALLDLATGLESRLGRAVDEAALARLGSVGAIAGYLRGLDQSSASRGEGRAR